MSIAVTAGVCIVLAVLALLLPRMSWWPQAGVDTTLASGQRAAGNLTGKAGDPAKKPLQSRRAVSRGAARGRAKMAT